MQWNDLLRELQEKKAKGQKISFSNANEDVSYLIQSNNPIRPKIFRVYSLGNHYGDIYFTKREAECMVWLLRGKTVNGVATLLKLSPRTVEYYLKNMKAKLRCRTKFELIDRVYESDFMKNVDFI